MQSISDKLRKSYPTLKHIHTHICAHIHKDIYHINTHTQIHIVYKSRLCSGFSYLKIQNLLKIR